MESKKVITDKMDSKTCFGIWLWFQWCLLKSCWIYANIYINQRLGAAHSKRWSKYVFLKFFVQKNKKKKKRKKIEAKFRKKMFVLNLHIDAGWRFHSQKTIDQWSGAIKKTSFVAKFWLNLADVKSTPSYSSGLHFLGIVNYFRSFSNILRTYKPPSVGSILEAREM